jgi:hypothetical protein
MKPVRTEQRNGYGIRVRTLAVHDTRKVPCATDSVTVGHAAFAQIARESEICRDEA